MLLLDKKNGNTLLGDTISKEITALEKLGVTKFYPLKTRSDKKYGWQYAPMNIIVLCEAKGLMTQV